VRHFGRLAGFISRTGRQLRLGMRQFARLHSARSGSFKDSEFLTSLKKSDNAKKGRASGTDLRDAPTLERSKRFMATRRMVRIFASGVSGHVASRDSLQWYFKIRQLYLSGQMDKVDALAVLRWLLAKQFHAATD
jgi:hypothetical protein